MKERAKPLKKENGGQQKQKAMAVRKETRKFSIGRLIGFILLTIFGVGLLGVGAGAGYATYLLKDLPSISPSSFKLSSASVVYDKNGTIIGRFTKDGDRQILNNVSQVTPYLVNSFIAAEDKTFRTNIGINPLAMARAAGEDLFLHKITSGASTITQQTVKLAIFPEQQRTFRRKVQEIGLAIELNHMLTKNEIMTDYLNWVYMGRMGTQNVYGVKTASELMFHQNPANLNLPEAAFLATIPNNPAYYSPYRFVNGHVVISAKHALVRQHYILKQMLLNQLITQSDYDTALQFNIQKNLQQPPTTSQRYPYLISDNIEPLVDKYLVQAGLYDTVQQADAALPIAGYKIYTSLDMKLQADVDKVLSSDSLFKGTDKKFGKTTDFYQAGVTLVDNKTGGILAIGGGRPDHYLADQIDHSDIPRQTGSAIKPLIDYGPAIDLRKLTAGSVIFDGPIKFKSWAPTDAESEWSGIVTARYALAQSLNVPAIRVLQMITPEVGTSYLPKMGITTSSRTLSPVIGQLGARTLDESDTHQLTTAIGGLKYGLTVQQMTSAFTVFPNEGVWRQPFIVSKIVDRNNTPVFQFKPVVNHVFTPQTAYILNSMLQDVVKKGTAYDVGVAFPGNYVIAGKTGTTDNRTDGWFMGYTQKYTMGIWMGYNHNESIGYSLSDPVYSLKFKLWNDIMRPIFAKNPPTSQFTKPPGIVSEQICDKSGMLPTSLSKAQNDVYTEIFAEGTQPTQMCNVHVQAQYVVIGGKKYLATTNTPPAEVHTGIFLKPPFAIPAGYVSLDSGLYLPTQADPRGGQVLTPGNAVIAPQPPIGTPQTVAATITSNGVQLSWNAVSGATGYTVWRATAPTGPYVNIGGPITSTTFTDSQLPAGSTSVYYQIYAMSNSGLSNPSTPVQVNLTGSGNAGGGPNSANNNTSTTGNTGTANTTANTPTNGNNSTANQPPST